MTRFIKRFLLSVVFAAGFMVTQAQTALDDIGAGIRSGNVNTISRYFDESVTVKIAGSQSTYSSSQAEMILREFFGKNNPKSFEIEHTGGGNTSKYAIGSLVTTNGSYKAYFMVKLIRDNTYLIQEIRFER
jgi:hypothetical protein